MKQRLPMPIDEIGLISESDSDRRRRIWSQTSFAIAILGWLIIGTTLNTIIFNSFPLKLAAPEWQLSLISAFLSSCFAFLVGAILIALAPLFNPKDQMLLDWQRTMSRMAGLLAILMLLIIPLQFFLGSRALNGQTIKTIEAVNNFKGIAKRIGTINTEPELRAYVASLPNAPTLPAKFDAPYPVIKQRAIENITAQVNAATNNVEAQKSESLQLFLKEAIRNASQAVLMAAAFSALANLSANTRNVVTKFFHSLF
jgi:hypothetical protein